MLNFKPLSFKLFILISTPFIILIFLNFFLSVKDIKDRNYSYIENIYILKQNGNVILEKSASIPIQAPYPFYNTLINSNNNELITKDKHLTMKAFDISDKASGYVVIQRNRQQYEMELNREINTLILYMILYLSLSLISSYIIARNITKPLEKIIRKIKSTGPNEALIFDASAEKEYQYLSDIIAQKHNSLHKLNMHLEEEINRKNMDLQELNNDLEKKIKEAVNNLQKKEKLIQEQSRHIQIGDMISMIAHQWRQPLSVIAATTYSLLTKTKRKQFDLSTKEAQESYFKNLEKNLGEIQNYIQCLSKTTDNFRNFFKPEVSKERCNINDTVNQALFFIKTPMQNNNIEIKTQLNSVQYVELFKNEITQAILSILKNSQDNFLKNQSSENRIYIKTYDQNKTIVLEISDNGGGIEKENLEKIFDPYFSTKKDENGAGLSLYIAKTIIHTHNNGTLKVENRDEGATFIITFNL
jgi:signal transduction histidine kinase